MGGLRQFPRRRFHEKAYAVNLETGTPSVDGRYVVYVQAASHQIRDWCEAKLATWHKGRWDLGVPVFYFAGPLPAMKIPKLKPEWDL